MFLRRLTLVLVLAAASCAPSGADDPEPVEGPAGEAGLELENLRRVTVILHEKMTALAAAMPEEALDRRPMDDVRSPREVFQHVAADNWYVPALMGYAAPEETGVTSDGMTMRAYQEREMTREEMEAALDASFVFLIETMDRSARELDREVVLGTPTSVGDVWIRAVVHLHEHLGQSIAYARTNDVVPPWSR